MKKTLLALAATLSFSNVYAINSFESLALFQANLKQNAASIWPGFNIGNHPMIIPNDKSVGDNLYAFDLKTSSGLWQLTYLQSLPVYYMAHDTIGAHTFAENYLNSLETSQFFLTENQSSIVLPTFHYLNDVNHSPKRDIFNKTELADMYYHMYEMHDSPNSTAKRKLFQKYLEEIVITKSFYNPEVFSLLALELSVLQDYLTTKDPNLLKTFSAIHQTRTLLMDKNTKQFEAEIDSPFCYDYIMMKSQTFDGTDGAKIILDQSVNNLPSYISRHEMTSIEPQDFYDDYVDMLFTVTSIEQYALDTLYPEWKTIVESENVSSTPILQKQFPLSDADANSLTDVAKKNYGYTAFNQAISNALAGYMPQMEQAVAAYQNQPNSIEFIVKKSGNTFMNVSSTNTTSWRIDSATYLYSDVHWLNFHDNSFNFEAYNMPAFLESGYVSDYLFKFKTGKDTYISINNGAWMTLGEFAQSEKSVEVDVLIIKGATWWFPLSASMVMTGSHATMSAVNGHVEFAYDSSEMTTMRMKGKKIEANAEKSSRKKMRSSHFPFQHAAL